jgi:stage II sporulation protein D
MRSPRFLIPISLMFLAFGLVAQEAPTLSLEEQEEAEWILRKAEDGDSHAAGGKPELGPSVLGNPTESVRVIRVGLAPTTFNATTGAVVTEFAGGSNPAHAFADISNTVGTVHVMDKSTGKQIIDIEPGTIVRVRHIANAGYEVSISGSVLGIYAGPIFFRPTDATNFFRVENIRRSFITTQAPRYRGAIEITRGPLNPAQGFVYIVNIVEVEDYVPGVVVNEGISSFHIEALKTQAVAARGYAIANIGRNRAARDFDIYDSSLSQVYRGVISEHVKAIQAAVETTGLVGSYDGRIIEALYSSSFGGHSENNEWIFNFPSTSLPGLNPVPYLRAIYDGDGVPAANPADPLFWTTKVQPNIFDDCGRVSSPANSFSRWSYTLDGPTIRTRANVTGQSVLISGNRSGNVTNVEVLQRMSGSDRIAVARITFDTGVAEVRGWDNVRRVLGATPPLNTTTPAPRACGAGNIANNMVLNNPNVIQVNRDALGKFTTLSVWGGGWGHNLGMSQYGSHGRAKSGQTFLQILKAYYTGIDVGTYPIDIGHEPGSGPPTLRHTFYAPNAKGTLIVRSSGLKKLTVHINDTADFSFDEEDLAAAVVTLDVSPYLVQGLNTLQYNPAGRDGKATVIVAVE